MISDIRNIRIHQVTRMFSELQKTNICPECFKHHEELPAFSPQLQGHSGIPVHNPGLLTSQSFLLPYSPVRQKMQMLETGTTRFKNSFFPNVI